MEQTVIKLFFISGLAFWKCGSRKLYAVKFSKNSREPFKRAAKSKGKASYCDTSDDNDEDFTISSKKPKVYNQGDIQILNSETSEIK